MQSKAADPTLVVVSIDDLQVVECAQVNPPLAHRWARVEVGVVDHRVEADFRPPRNALKRLHEGAVHAVDVDNRLKPPERASSLLCNTTLAVGCRTPGHPRADFELNGLLGAPPGYHE